MINDTHIEYSEALEDAYQCLKNKDWNNATDFCNIALKYDPENGRAYLGLLLSSMNIQNMEALKKHSKELNMNERDLLEKAIAFSDDTTQKTLIAWRDHQYQKIYKEACDLAENKEANLEKAEQLFLSIDGYRDAEQKAQMCHAFADLSGEILNSDVKQYSVKKHRINMNDKVVEFENLTKQNRFMEKQLKHLLKLAFAE